MLVYLDTNAFGHLAARVGVTEADEQVLRNATAKGLLTIALSVVTIDEVVALVESNHFQAAQLLHLILDLAHPGKILKPPDLLLPEQIAAYARGDGPPDPYLELPQGASGYLRRMPAEAAGRSPELLEIGRVGTRQRQEFRTKLGLAQTEFRASRKVILQQYPNEKPPSFERYRRDNEGPFFEAFADREGVLEEVRARGIEGFAQIPSVRVAVGTSLSLTYASMIDNRQFQNADAPDMIHAIMATATNVFVTDDGRLAYLLRRLPDLPYQVWGLPELCRRTAAALACGEAER